MSLTLSTFLLSFDEWNHYGPRVSLPRRPAYLYHLSSPTNGTTTDPRCLRRVDLPTSTVYRPRHLPPSPCSPLRFRPRPDVVSGGELGRTTPLPCVRRNRRVDGVPHRVCPSPTKSLRGPGNGLLQEEVVGGKGRSLKRLRSTPRTEGPASPGTSPGRWRTPRRQTHPPWFPVSETPFGHLREGLDSDGRHGRTPERHSWVPLPYSLAGPGTRRVSGGPLSGI